MVLLPIGLSLGTGSWSLCLWAGGLTLGGISSGMWPKGPGDGLRDGREFFCRPG